MGRREKRVRIERDFRDGREKGRERYKRSHGRRPSTENAEEGWVLERSALRAVTEVWYRASRRGESNPGGNTVRK